MQKVQSYDEQIQEILNPKQLAERTLLDRLFSERQILSEIEMNKAKLEVLKQAKDELDKKKQVSKSVDKSKVLDTFALREFCDIVEEILKLWKFSEVGTVEFNENDMDILVKGKPRQSNGKGVRALLHSAISVGLMLYCKEKELPHPGWLLLDSPLTTLKENNNQDFADEVSGEIQEAFFNHLSKLREEQIIVLENKIPSQEIQSKINFIEFAGNGSGGRLGFFPI